jgi:hypothetical protein
VRTGEIGSSKSKTIEGLLGRSRRAQSAKSQRQVLTRDSETAKRAN